MLAKLFCGALTRRHLQPTWQTGKAAGTDFSQERKTYEILDAQILLKIWTAGIWRRKTHHTHFSDLGEGNLEPLANLSAAGWGSLGRRRGCLGKWWCGGSFWNKLDLMDIGSDFKTDKLEMDLTSCSLWFSSLCWCNLAEGDNLELVLVKEKGERMEGSAVVTSARYQAQTSTSDDDLLVSFSSLFTNCIKL